MKHAGMPDSPWPGRADRAAVRQSKRDAVLRTAVRFFNTQGFHSTSLDDVAAALQVTKPTIYHYFANKDEILFECVQLGLEGIRDAAETVQAGGGSGMQRLTALTQEYAHIMMRDFGMCVIRTGDDQLGPESLKRFRALKREINDMLQGVIEEGMRDGSIAKGDPRIVAFTVAGALNWIARWYDPEGQMTPDEIATGVVETLIGGLAPRKE